MSRPSGTGGGRPARLLRLVAGDAVVLLAERRGRRHGLRSLGVPQVRADQHDRAGQRRGRTAARRPGRAGAPQSGRQGDQPWLRPRGTALDASTLPGDRLRAGATLSLVTLPGRRSRSSHGLAMGKPWTTRSTKAVGPAGPTAFAKNGYLHLADALLQHLVERPSGSTSSSLAVCFSARRTVRLSASATLVSPTTTRPASPGSRRSPSSLASDRDIPLARWPLIPPMTPPSGRCGQDRWREQHAHRRAGRNAPPGAVPSRGLALVLVNLAAGVLGDHGGT